MAQVPDLRLDNIEAPEVPRLKSLEFSEEEMRWLDDLLKHPSGLIDVNFENVPTLSDINYQEATTTLPSSPWDTTNSDQNDSTKQGNLVPELQRSHIVTTGIDATGLPSHLPVPHSLPSIRIASSGAPVITGLNFMPTPTPVSPRENNSEATVPTKVPSGAQGRHKGDRVIEHFGTREECVARYREKKSRRHLRPRFVYESRKRTAVMKPRIKGRFVKKSEMADYLRQYQDQVVDRFD